MSNTISSLMRKEKKFSRSPDTGRTSLSTHVVYCLESDDRGVRSLVAIGHCGSILITNHTTPPEGEGNKGVYTIPVVYTPLFTNYSLTLKTYNSIFAPNFSTNLASQAG